MQEQPKIPENVIRQQQAQSLGLGSDETPQRHEPSATSRVAHNQPPSDTPTQGVAAE